MIDVHIGYTLCGRQECCSLPVRIESFFAFLDNVVPKL